MDTRPEAPFVASITVVDNSGIEKAGRFLVQRWVSGDFAVVAPIVPSSQHDGEELGTYRTVKVLDSIHIERRTVPTWMGDPASLNAMFEQIKNLSDIQIKNIWLNMLPPNPIPDKYVDPYNSRDFWDKAGLIGMDLYSYAIFEDMERRNISRDPKDW